MAHSTYIRTMLLMDILLMSDIQREHPLSWTGPTKYICPLCQTISMIQWPAIPLSDTLDIRCAKCNIISGYRIVNIEALAYASIPPTAAWPTHIVDKDTA